MRTCKNEMKIILLIMERDLKSAIWIQLLKRPAPSTYWPHFRPWWKLPQAPMTSVGRENYVRANSNFNSRDPKWIRDWIGKNQHLEMGSETNWEPAKIMAEYSQLIKASQSHGTAGGTSLISYKGEKVKRGIATYSQVTQPIKLHWPTGRMQEWSIFNLLG